MVRPKTNHLFYYYNNDYQLIVNEKNIIFENIMQQNITSTSEIIK